MSIQVWVASVVAALLIFGGLAVGLSMERRAPPPRSEHSQLATSIPAEMVAVTPEGKTFHQASCRYLHGKAEMVTAEEASARGYAPCVRCVRKALGK